MSGDRIEKTVVVPVSLAATWAAISDATRFGRWFGARFDAPFVAGAEAVGRIVPTEVDAEVAKLQEPHRGTPLTLMIETVDPMRLFSFRWHPFAVDPVHDYAAEPMTRVAFALDEVAGGTRLTITESGFDRLPVERRADAFAANAGGWAHQARMIAAYLAAGD